MPDGTSPVEKHPGGGPPPGLRASHADRDQAVEVLRVAAGDGRLTAEELDERVGAALSARTVGELARLTADLPSSSSGTAAVGAKDLVRIERRFGAVERVGRWVVPRRLELVTEFCEVTLDFTQAVLTGDVLHVDVDMRGKNLTLITGPGVVVDTDGLALEFGKLRIRRTPDPEAPVTLRVVLVGKKSFGRVVVRPPRRSVARRLFSRRGGPAPRRAPSPR